MVPSHVEFDNRLKRLVRKHSAMSRGYRHKMRTDGLIVVQPRRNTPRLSIRAVLIFLAAFFVFKGFLIANLGPAAYDERLAVLAEGAVFEQAGAWVMQMDPLSSLVADQLGPILR